MFFWFTNKIRTSLLILRIFTPAVLAIVPLTSDLDYEFSEALCIINVVFFALWFGTEKSTSNLNYRLEFIRSVKRFLLPIVFFDLAIIWIAMVAGNHAHWYRTYGFYLLLPFVGSWLGSVLGYICRFFLVKKSWLWITVLLISILILNLFWLYFTAPIFVYSIWWGYFAGPIYDEWIPLTSTLLFHRIFALWFVLALFATGDLILRRKNRIPIHSKFTLVLTMVWLSIIVVFLLRDNWGWDTSYTTLEKKLNIVYDNSHVAIYSDTTSKFLTNYVGSRVKQVTDWLKIKPNKIRIFIYPDPQTKKNLMGAGGTNFAKVWRNEVHVNSDDVEFTIKHEATHVLASSFGHPLYSTTKPGMLEGLAVAAAWDDPVLTPHEWSAALYKLNKLPDITAMMEPLGFWSSSSGLAYTVSGSFVRFLRDKYPIENIHRVYALEDFERVYGQSLDSLQMQWKRFLFNIKSDSFDMHTATTLLQPSIFRRRCPHYVADLQNAYFTAVELKDFDQALESIDQIIATGTSSERWVLRRARIYLQQKNYDEALSQIDEILNKKSLSYTIRGWALLLKADIVFCQGQKQKALGLIKEILTSYDRTTPIYEAAKWSDHLIRQNDGDSLYASWLDAVDQNKMDAWYSIHLDKKEDTVILNKLISHLYQTSQYDSIFSFIGNHDIAFSDSNSYIRYYRLLGDAAMRTERWNESEQYYNSALLYSIRAADKAQFNDRLELIHYMKSRN